MSLRPRSWRGTLFPKPLERLMLLAMAAHPRHVVGKEARQRKALDALNRLRRSYAEDNDLIAIPSLPLGIRNKFFSEPYRYYLPPYWLTSHQLHLMGARLLPDALPVYVPDSSVLSPLDSRLSEGEGYMSILQDDSVELEMLHHAGDGQPIPVSEAPPYALLPDDRSQLRHDSMIANFKNNRIFFSLTDVADPLSVLHFISRARRRTYRCLFAGLSLHNPVNKIRTHQSLRLAGDTGDTSVVAAEHPRSWLPRVSSDDYTKAHEVFVFKSRQNGFSKSTYIEKASHAAHALSDCAPLPPLSIQECFKGTVMLAQNNSLCEEIPRLGLEAPSNCEDSNASITSLSVAAALESLPAQFRYDGSVFEDPDHQGLFIRYLWAKFGGDRQRICQWPPFWITLDAASKLLPFRPIPDLKDFSSTIKSNGVCADGDADEALEAPIEAGVILTHTCVGADGKPNQTAVRWYHSSSFPVPMSLPEDNLTSSPSQNALTHGDHFFLDRSTNTMVHGVVGNDGVLRVAASGCASGSSPVDASHFSSLGSDMTSANGEEKSTNTGTGMDPLLADTDSFLKDSIEGDGLDAADALFFEARRPMHTFSQAVGVDESGGGTMEGDLAVQHTTSSELSSSSSGVCDALGLGTSQAADDCFSSFSQSFAHLMPKGLAELAASTLSSHNFLFSRQRSFLSYSLCSPIPLLSVRDGLPILAVSNLKSPEGELAATTTTTTTATSTNTPPVQPAYGHSSELLVLIDQAAILFRRYCAAHKVYCGVWGTEEDYARVGIKLVDGGPIGVRIPRGPWLRECYTPNDDGPKADHFQGVGHRRLDDDDGFIEFFPAFLTTDPVTALQLGYRRRRSIASYNGELSAFAFGRDGMHFD